nr:ribosomal protein S5 [Coccidia sp. AB-2023a]
MLINFSDNVIYKILDIKQVSRTRKGGRQRRFRVLLICGNYTGWLGIGIGKGNNITEATNKARYSAYKYIYYFNITLSGSIFKSIETKFKKTKLILKPLSIGKGLIVPSLVRNILELIGYKNVWGVLIGSNNKLNMAKATINALLTLNKHYLVYLNSLDR